VRESKVTKARASAFSKKHRANRKNTPAAHARRGKPKVEQRAPPPHYLHPVAKTTNTSPASETAGTETSFETAMERLETIVEAMEAGDVPLAELLTKYEEGTRLVARCEERLKTAELKIEQLKRQRDGSLRPEPFAAVQAPESA